VFARAYWALLPLVARAQPSGGAILYGSLLGAIGVGAIAGAAFLPRVKKRWGADRFVAGCTVGTALATLGFALSRNSGTSLAASVLAGISLIGAVSAVTLSAQVALPDWVRGRGLSIQVAVLFGALSLGGLLWGKVAALTSTSISLLLAALAGLLLIPLSWRWKLQTGEAVDFTPSLHWPAPVTLHDVDGDRGPVLVTIEYRVDAESRRRFLGALFRLSRERIRDGAYSWRLFEDPAIDGRFVEAFLTESWQEHLRHHSRITKSDQLYEEALALCTEGAPAVITHLIQVHKAE
jgi:MFS family permease